MLGFFIFGFLIGTLVVTSIGTALSRVQPAELPPGAPANPANIQQR